MVYGNEYKQKTDIYYRDDAGNEQKAGYLKDLGAPVIVWDAESADVGGKNTESTDTGHIVDQEIINGYGAKMDNGGGSSETFSYAPFNFFGDPLFQMYQSMYMGNAQKAMKGAIADSALLTGGYGNSFGQIAGQQAYADVMDDFYAAIPSLFSAAYSVYDSERAAAKAAWDEDQAKIAEATEKAQGEYDAAVDSEQDRAYDYYVEDVKSGEMTWEEAKEALLGITYTDHNGKEVSLFTDEDVAEYEDKYNASVVAAEAAKLAAVQEQAEAINNITEAIAKNPDLNTDAYITNELLKTYPNATSEQLTAWIQSVRGGLSVEVQDDGMPLTPEMLEELWELYRNDTKNSNVYEEHVKELVKQGYSQKEIDSIYDQGIAELQKWKSYDYDIADQTWDWLGWGIDTDDIYNYRDDADVVQTISGKELRKQLKARGMTHKEATEWIRNNLEGSKIEEVQSRQYEKIGNSYVYENRYGQKVYLTKNQLLSSLKKGGMDQDQAEKWIEDNVKTN